MSPSFSLILFFFLQFLFLRLDKGVLAFLMNPLPHTCPVDSRLTKNVLLHSTLDDQDQRIRTKDQTSSSEDTKKAAKIDKIVDILKTSPNRWRGQELEPGVGGIWPGDPKAKRHTITVVDKKTGKEWKTEVPEDRYIYWQLEEDGVDIPMINKKRMCRNGCCTTCALKVKGYEKGGDAKFKMEGALGLLKDLRQEGWILSCCTLPKSDLTLELQDEDEVYVRQWSEGFEGGGVEWGGFLPEDD